MGAVATSFSVTCRETAPTRVPRTLVVITNKTAALGTELVPPVMDGQPLTLFEVEAVALALPPITVTRMGEVLVTEMTALTDIGAAFCGWTWSWT